MPAARSACCRAARPSCSRTSDGQIELTHSVSAGLDYAAVGPEHAFYHDTGRIEYTYAIDEEAMEAFDLLSRLEGIIPALESAHAVAYCLKLAPTLGKDKVIIVQPLRPRRQGRDAGGEDQGSGAVTIADCGLRIAE